MRNAGFTLVELLIVIAIIGILSVALLPAITSGPARARDAARMAAVKEASDAMENYNLSEGSYPSQPLIGNDRCLNFTLLDLCTGPAADTQCDATPDVRSAFSKIPNISRAGDPGRSAEILYYKTGITDANYMIAIQVERPGNANVGDGITAATLRGYTMRSEILDVIDGTPSRPTSCAPDDPCLYAIVK